MSKYTTDAASVSSPAKTHTYAQKWGNDDAFVQKGYAQIPLLLFDYGGRLLLEPDEAYLVCHIWRFKYTPSDEGPSEKKLAELIGKSDDTIRKLLHRLVAKGFLSIERTRGDFGYYTHTTYNFMGLRAHLNECYYQDHPQDRPKGVKPLTLPIKPTTTAQPRGVVRQRQASRKTAPSQDAEHGLPSPQSCGTLIDSLELINSLEDLSLSLSEPERKEPEQPAEPWGDLSCERRQPFVEAAMTEMQTNNPEMAWHVEHGVVRVRARNLYNLAVKRGERP